MAGIAERQARERLAAACSRMQSGMPGLLCLGGAAVDAGPRHTDRGFGIHGMEVRFEWLEAKQWFWGVGGGMGR
jgi:hypothetical protein